MTHQGYGANGLPQAGETDPARKQGGRSPRGARPKATGAPQPSIPWLLLGTVALFATVAGVVIVDGSLLGSTPKTDDDSFSQVMLIIGAGFVVAGIAWDRSLRPWAAEIRALVDGSIAVPGEVLETTRSGLIGTTATVRFVASDGMELTRPLTVPGRYSVGQRITVRHNPANPDWLVPDGPDPANAKALAPVARLGWMVLGMGVLLLTSSALGLV